MLMDSAFCLLNIENCSFMIFTLFFQRWHKRQWEGRCPGEEVVQLARRADGASSTQRRCKQWACLITAGVVFVISVYCWLVYVLYFECWLVERYALVVHVCIKFKSSQVVACSVNVLLTSWLSLYVIHTSSPSFGIVHPFTSSTSTSCAYLE